MLTLLMATLYRKDICRECDSNIYIIQKSAFFFCTWRNAKVEKIYILFNLCVIVMKYLMRKEDRILIVCSDTKIKVSTYYLLWLYAKDVLNLLSV